MITLEAWHISAVAIAIALLSLAYWFLLRPILSARKAHRQLVASVKRGDEVLTTWGVYGKVEKIDGRVVTLRLGENTVVRMVREHVGGRWER